MDDLHPDWFSMPIRSLDVFNAALYPVRLRAMRFEGSCLLIRSISEKSGLQDRNHEQLREIIKRISSATIELGDELRLHNDFRLVE